MARTKQPRTYYTLLIRAVYPTDPWEIAFGSYDREDVESERDEYRDKGWTKRTTKIITTTDQQADINRAVFELNEAGQ
ncbi:hypothetical protein FJ420_02025 [Mesorhizobium sp. B3-1-3]|uniref:hypothetical protein n=1 Tax=unclassified Mesorhizobium TaxID=325217 RepID=UPI00112C5FBF|nr:MULTISPECIES: hypothetical protein [unclassified Mesorhizobium]TPI67608.1 hypothetical protein FJ424_09995 [Mesorhizobium sp. B3-1-8]TPI75654.1 hypothetical protein FJ420_02025 [Mesorhizobium sp. B3-1-3]